MDSKSAVPSFPSRTSLSAPPEFNCKRAIAMFFAGPEKQIQDRNVRSQTSSASAKSQWFLPDPNSNPNIRVIPAGPQLQAVDGCVPRLARAANSRSECFALDFHCERSIEVFHTGLGQQTLDRSVTRWTSDPNGELRIRMLPARPQPQIHPEDVSDSMSERMSKDMPDRMRE